MSFLLRLFRPKSQISQPMEVVHAVHLGTDLKWEFDPLYDAKDIFQKLQVIGKGGFGTVCKVLHIPSQAILAGKLINPKLVNNPNSKKEIEHEIELMKEVESDYTIHYYGSVQFEGSLMILMEYCDCGSLRNILDAREQVLSEDQIAIVMRDLLLGLHIIHTRYRIVHRDIKAANILLTSSGGIRIADFGVSRRFEKTGTIHTMTIVGTPYWMAPEVINGTAYSFPADLWSVGITAVELAEGAPPYVELAPTKAMIEIFVKGFPGYRFKKMHSPEFMDFVSHCVQKKDSDRWDIPRLLEHPFIKRAERMPRLEVLNDLIKCGLKITKSQPGEGSKIFSGNMSSDGQNFNTNSDLFSFSTQKNASSAPNLNSATNFDTFGNSGFQNQNGGQLASGARFDTFSIGAGGNNNSFDSAALNSGTNFNQGSNLKAANNFDSAALNSGTSFDSFAANYKNNFDSAALNSGTSFDSFAANYKNNFDSAALNSGTSFDSFAANYKNNFDSAALNSGTNFGAFPGGNKSGFDSAALMSSNDFNSFAANRNNNMKPSAGFDSFASPQNNGFDSAALNSGTNFGNFVSSRGANLKSSAGFDSFAANYNQNNGFDSAALNSGSNFGVFASRNNNGFDSAALNSGTNFGSFAPTNGANLKSSAGFDSFAANYNQNNGFDSAALNSGSNFGVFASGNNNGFDSAALNSGSNFGVFASGNNNGFDSAALNSGSNFGVFASGNNNGFDSAALNSGSNFGVFVGGNNNGFDSAALNSGTNFGSFAPTNGANLKSSAGFDSFAANYNQNSGFVSATPNSAGFDSFASNNGAGIKSSTGFDSFAKGGNSAGFDSFAAGGNNAGFDSFVGGNNNFNSFVAAPNNGFDSVSLNSGTNFVSPVGANQQGFDSFISANGADLKSSTGFDSFAANQNKGFDSFQLNSVNNQMPIFKADSSKSSGFNSFISENGSDIKSDGFEPFEINSQQDQQQQLQQQNSQKQQTPQQQQGLSLPQHQQQQQQQQEQIQKSGSGPIPIIQKPREIQNLNYRSMQMKKSAHGKIPPPVQREPSAKGKEDIPHVTFSMLPDHIYRQVARSNSLKTPYVNYDSVVQSAKEGRPLPPVNYQQDDSLIAQQRIRQQNQYRQMMQKKMMQPLGLGNQEEEEVPTWSPPKSIVLFLIFVALYYGPEGFVLTLLFIIAVSYIIYQGNKKVESNKGLVPRNFQKK